MVPENLRGNVAYTDPETGVWIVRTEWSGSFPLYYLLHQGGFLFSSRLRPLIRATQAAVDPIGVLQFLREGFTLSGRSLAAGIRRAQPGQVISFDARTGVLGVAEESLLWASEADSDDAVAVAWRALTAAARDGMPEDGALGLMMSAEWDSRTLLAALLPHSRGGLLAYSHGDSASRELNIAGRICRDTGVAHRVRDLDGDQYRIDALHRGLERVETVVFPHWRRAGRLLAVSGATVAAAGVYSEVVGGHYQEAMLLSGTAKIAAVATAMLRRQPRVNKSAEQEAARSVAFLSLAQLEKPWYLRESAWDYGVRQKINGDIVEEVDRLRVRGVQSAERLIEVSLTEHRGAQYWLSDVRRSRDEARTTTGCAPTSSLVNLTRGRVVAEHAVRETHLVPFTSVVHQYQQ